MGAPNSKVIPAEYFKSGYVLVTDDMTNMRRTIRNILKQLGAVNILEADDGDTALDILRATPNCRFLFIDWNMPRMPGIHVAREVRADPAIQDTPIVMITAEINSDQVAQAGEIGVNGYLIKPFNFQNLADKVQAILDARANPPEHVLLLKDGELHLRRGDVKQAMDCFEKAKALSESARVHVHIGEALEIMGDHDKAHQSYSAAILQNPKYLKAHAKSADLHIKQGNDDGALAALKRANEISPGNSARHISIGKIYLKKGDEAKAHEAFGEAVKQEPVKANEIAEELLKMGKAELAEQYFRASLKKSADTIHVYNRLGIALRRQGKWKEAVYEYETALKVDPKDDGVHFNMAKAYLEGGDKKQADVCFNKALALNPSLKSAVEQAKKLQETAGET